MAVHVTNHACLRYQERVAPVSIEVARERLSSAVIEQAAAFGAMFVRLGTGQRIVIHDGRVITVLTKGNASNSWASRSGKDGTGT